MKKYFILLLLILSTQLFAKENATILSVESTYILDGKIDNKYAITMYLTTLLDTKNNTKKVSGKYYYNNIGEFIYLGESVLSKKSTVTLKEYTTYSDADDKKNSTGEFTGIFSDDTTFKGTWKNNKNSFEFSLKARDNVVEIKNYVFTKSDAKFENTSFDYNSRILQIVSSKKSASIEKINKELRRRHEFETLYSEWKKWIKEDPNSVFNGWSFESSTYLNYIDNNILSVDSVEWSYTGGARPSYISSSTTYTLSSSKKLTANDLIINVDDYKLIALMRKKLKEHAESDDVTINEFYYDFENIRLGDSYSVSETGITFLYDHSEISHYIPEAIEIDFTYDELKPFVKKSSPLWYLFE